MKRGPLKRGPRRLVAGVLVAGALAAALLLGGCGIPDDTAVQRVGPGPSTGAAAGEDVAPQERNGRDTTSSAATFVRYYLEAAAGDPNTALERVKQFLSPSAAATFKASADLRVIHLVEDPLINPGSDEVTLQAKTVGVLGHNGILDPVTDGSTNEYKLTVSSINGKSGLFVTNAPSVLLLSDTALNTFYERRTLYFWNLEHTGLVPDMRYLSRDVPREQKPNEIIKWLVDGPAEWLDDAVEQLPEGTQLVGNVPAVSDDKLQINLTGQAVQPPDDPAALDRLRRQLMWSLRPNLLPRTLELRVGSQEQNDYDDSDYLTSNAAYGLESVPERFVIYNNQVRRMSRYPNATDAIPVLPPEANHNVKAAALAASGTRQYAALVVAAAGRSGLRVGSAPPDEQTDLIPVSLPGGSPGQPVWAITSDDPQAPAIGLITVGGRLYSFTSDGAPVSSVAWPGPSGSITAVAVAPDGRRIALVAAGTLYVGALSTSGDGLQLLAPKRILTPTLRQVSAADWSSETMLTIAGTRADRNRVAIVDVAIDGAEEQERLGDIGTEVVSYLSAYPVGPTSGAQLSGNVAYVANGAAFDVVTAPVRIGVGDLADPVTSPPAGVVPTAPFFLR